MKPWKKVAIEYSWSYEIVSDSFTALFIHSSENSSYALQNDGAPLFPNYSQHDSTANLTGFETSLNCHVFPPRNFGNCRFVIRFIVK